MVNRIWKHHFGKGIVHSLGNFGKTGDRPTHPDLLDFLAREFIRREWSLKGMHRLLVQSATYQQSSEVTDEAQSLDPANQLWSRMPMRRLDAETLRDSILWAAGALNDAGGGPSEPVQVRADGLVVTGSRRSVYLQQLRKHPPSLLESFDLPSMNPNCLERSESLVPTQALHLWNDMAVRQLAGRFGDRVSSCGNEEEQVRQIYWIALGRPPAHAESSTCVETLRELKESWLKQLAASNDTAQEEAERRALSTLCHTILNSANFIYVD